MSFSNMCLFLLTQQANVSTFLGLRTIFGPLYPTLASIGCILNLFSITGFQISTIACLFFKNLKIISPSTTLSLNDEFWYAFISVSTIVVSMMNSFSGQSTILYLILNGDSSLPHVDFEQFGIRK